MTAIGVAIVTAGCTTRETASIDLLLASAKPPKMAMSPPKMPPPKMICASDTDCTMPKSRCDVASASCVECIGDPDCGDPKRAFCSRDAGRCVECAMDADCAEPGKPRCEPSTRSCVECLEDADCTRDPMRAVCDPRHQCGA
jgi:hypothetical protein